MLSWFKLFFWGFFMFYFDICCFVYLYHCSLKEIPKCDHGSQGSLGALGSSYFICRTFFNIKHIIFSVDLCLCLYWDALIQFCTFFQWWCWKMSWCTVWPLSCLMKPRRKISSSPLEKQRSKDKVRNGHQQTMPHQSNVGISRPCWGSYFLKKNPLQVTAVVRSGESRCLFFQLFV